MHYELITYFLIILSILAVKNLYKRSTPQMYAFIVLLLRIQCVASLGM